jgi:hypothetical protein
MGLAGGRAVDPGREIVHGREAQIVVGPEVVATDERVAAVGCHDLGVVP